MLYKSSITSQGQVTLPADIRRLFGLKKGDQVAFEKKGDEVIVRPVRDLLDLRGSIKSNVKYSDKKADEAIAKHYEETYEK